MLGRIGVGVGEAGGTPPSTAIVSDYFPADRRPMAMTVLALGAPIGAYLGADFAGKIAHLYNWRAAFIALGLPGLVMGVLVYLTVREPVRGRLDGVLDELRPSLRQSLKFLWQQKAAFHVVMGGGLCALWGWGLIWWTPTFLQRAYNLDVGQAGAVTGNIHLIGGSLATIGTAWILSRPTMADPRRVVWLLAAGIAFATIPSIIAYWTHSLWRLQAHVLDIHPGNLFLHRSLFRIAEQFVAVPHAQHVHRHFAPGGQYPEHRRRAAGAWVHSATGSPVPAAVDAASLRAALLILAPSGFWAAYHLWLASRTIIEDQKRAIGYTKAWSP